MLSDGTAGYTNGQLIILLADLTLSQVRDLRAAGISTKPDPEHTQALGILIRELGPRPLQPMVEQFWNRLAQDAPTAGPPPELEIKIRPVP
ncbi:hypothetical protein CcI156_03805 [Frankia sp. CcI156]|jgi:hypothetical protein|nr:MULTISPECIES: hypothetical protein [Frankia]OHV54143.1 hypothetical protein CgIS1_12760 [Frankia sp. CgIS1]OFB43002.1 hypothetical protein Manayef4_13090 [Frankia sp. CgIM4]ONH28996.1 hypothetical protein CcI156_03805 [Frankia sp. CcI156]ORT53676.1 hypothetical protein KBI5_06270 [Frankia sp. KB5]ORT94866.1 hypothetical protein UK99_14915 [Frankia casuarinae]